MPTLVDEQRNIDADRAAREAAIGAGVGAVKYGILSAVGLAGAYWYSPVVRNLTIQFRVYLWMCPTTIGSMVEADNRLVRYEHMVRARRRVQQEQAREEAMAAEFAELEAYERRKAAAAAGR